MAGKHGPVLVLLMFLALPARSGQLTSRGYWKSGITAIHTQTPDTTGGIGYASLRLSVRSRPVQFFRFEAAYEITPAITDSLTSVQDSGTEFRFCDLDELLYPDETESAGGFRVMQNLDRLNLELRTSPADIRIGRQAVFWGISKTVSPTDFIAPFAFNTVDTDYRRGVDAVRMTIPVGMMSELDAGWLFGKDGSPSANALYVRSRLYTAETDINVLVANFRENLMIGGSLNRSIGGASAWIECAWSRTGVFAYGNPAEESFTALSTGADYSWGGGAFYGFLEYHFNSAGSDDMNEYNDEISSPAYTTGGIYLLGRHYLCPGITWQISPLTSISCQNLTNLTDPSCYFIITGEHSVAEDVVLEIGLFAGLGPDSSDFGGYADNLHALVSMYF